MWRSSSSGPSPTPSAPASRRGQRRRFASALASVQAATAGLSTEQHGSTPSRSRRPRSTGAARSRRSSTRPQSTTSARNKQLSATAATGRLVHGRGRRGDGQPALQLIDVGVGLQGGQNPLDHQPAGAPDRRGIPSARAPRRPSSPPSPLPPSSKVPLLAIAASPTSTIRPPRPPSASASSRRRQDDVERSEGSTELRRADRTTGSASGGHWPH